MKENEFFSLFHSITSEMKEKINEAKKLLFEKEEVADTTDSRKEIRRAINVKFLNTWFFGFPLIRLCLQIEEFVEDSNLEFEKWKKLKEGEKNIPQLLKILSRWLTSKQKKDLIKSTDLCCSTCSGILTNSICISCLNKRDELDACITFKDIGRTNTSEKFKYTQLVHFKDAIKRYQGKQSLVIPEELMKLIRDEMKLKKLTTKTLTKSHIFNILESNKFIGTIKLADFYGHINLLHHKITDIPCPDISHLEGKLLERFETFEEVYADVTKRSTGKKGEVSIRKHSINVDYKLGRILQLSGVAVSRKDFHCLRTRDKQDEHDTVWRAVCKKIEWPIMHFI